MSKIIVVDVDDLRKVIKETITQCIVQKESETYEGFIKIDEVCKLLQVSKPTIHLWKKQGKLPFHKIGKKLFFKKSEVLSSPIVSKIVG